MIYSKETIDETIGKLTDKVNEKMQFLEDHLTKNEEHLVEIRQKLNEHIIDSKKKENQKDTDHNFKKMEEKIEIAENHLLKHAKLIEMLQQQVNTQLKDKKEEFKLNKNLDNWMARTKEGTMTKNIIKMQASEKNLRICPEKFLDNHKIMRNKSFDSYMSKTIKELENSLPLLFNEDSSVAVKFENNMNQSKADLKLKIDNELS